MLTKLTHLLALTCVFLAGCGGGLDTITPAQENSTSTQATSISAKLLPDNQVQLKLSGWPAMAQHVCLRQGTDLPSVDDDCFTPISSSPMVQTRSFGSPSNTQRVKFTSWTRQDRQIQFHGSVSLPGKTCSAAAYAALAGVNSSLPAVCILTGSASSVQESVLLLEPVKAPISTANFLHYVNQGFYDQTVFHRFLKGSLGVVQGGGFVHSGAGYVAKAATRSAIPLESTISSGLSHLPGTIAMARTSEPDSATSGFFVNTSNNATAFNSQNLRDGYAVFGHFVHGVESWSQLLNAVSGGPEVINPSVPMHLHWAYQIR